jgi:hypothetical protein
MAEAEEDWPELPTETEIYILPNGEIVVADLPAELAAQLAQLTQLHEIATPCATSAQGEDSWCEEYVKKDGVKCD